MGEGLLLFSTLLAGCFLFLWLLHAQPSPPAPEDEAVNASLVTTGRGIVGLCGVLLAAAMFLMPPWQDLLIPPFGSGQQFAGYSPVFWPPHNPWTLPPLADRPFANAQHEYRKDWTLFLVQVLAVGLVTVAAMVVLPGRFLAGIASHQTTGSQGGAILGGIGALAIGLIGATAIMAPLLEAVPRGRVATTLLLLAGYLGAILGGCLIGARLGHASMARVLAGAAAGQLAVAYLVFVLLPDASPGSHRLLLLVWELATLGGLAVGVVWAKRNCNAPAAAVNAVSGFGDRADRG